MKWIMDYYALNISIQNLSVIGGRLLWNCRIVQIRIATAKSILETKSISMSTFPTPVSPSFHTRSRAVSAASCIG